MKKVIRVADLHQFCEHLKMIQNIEGVEIKMLAALLFWLLLLYILNSS